MAKVDIVRINYKGTGQALTDVMSGQVQMMFTAPGGAAPHIKSGRLRALGVTSAEPTRLMPGVPTVASALPGYEFTSKAGVLAPAGTPPAIVQRLNQEIVRVLAQQDVKDKLLAIGLEAAGSTPDAFHNRMKGDLARIGKLIKDAGIVIE
jgi:tripartite-type tricarboxylate transporter receptor subunit TctC